ncbi:hypothetical protein D3C75_1031250 [compost metagenome]
MLKPVSKIPPCQHSAPDPRQASAPQLQPPQCYGRPFSGHTVCAVPRDHLVHITGSNFEARRSRSHRGRHEFGLDARITVGQLARFEGHQHPLQQAHQPGDTHFVEVTVPGLHQPFSPGLVEVP